jgi:Mg-chelatase subunit ChlD
MNVSDVSFKLAAAALEKGQMPDPASIRSEEFINAFDYRDPEAAPGTPVAFNYDRALYPFAHNRELLRFSLKTAAAGRQAGRPLNIVLLLDNSGSMERADRVDIIREALRVLAAQLQPQDTFSIVTFARTARLRVDGIPGNQAAAAAEEIAKLTPEGGTNLGEALDIAYQTALHHYLANGDNRVILLTDGAANLGDVDPDSLKHKVEAKRKQGISLDCFGIGWEGYNDDLLEVLTRDGDGRYGFINTPEEANTEFVTQIAGALHVAAQDVKVQVEFNPNRVTSYRQIGYAKHQLTKEQFRDNTVAAAQIAAQEAGNALYTIEINPQGEGSIGTVRVRYKVPGTSDYREQAWDVPYTGSAMPLEQSSSAMRLAATTSAFSEWLATSPFADQVTTDQLLNYLNGIPQIYGADTRPQKLEWMIRQAKSISGK